MQIIPVLDLKGGAVVRARMGERAQYRPIETPLAAGSDPVAVARGLLALFPFPALYVADLDAIAGTGSNEPALAALAAAFPRLRLWVDAGASGLEQVNAALKRSRTDVVLGSESQKDAHLLRVLAGDPRIVLSLDFRGGAFEGPQELLGEPAAWPQRVIAMTLARVGSGAGPDLARLAEIQAVAGARSVYAAGGVRDVGDLIALRKRGIAGALVATALHDGRLRGADIEALAGPGDAGLSAPRSSPAP